MRKLADYAFMLRDWKLAHSTYEILRGDFNNDKAWRYHAGANEMAAISLLLMPQNLSAKSRVEMVDTAFDSAFYSYITRCSEPYGAMRCLTLGLELLRLRGGSSIDDAAKWGTRLLESKILGPVGDALIKERLAVCYASKQGLGTLLWGARRRKSALWSVLGAEAWLEQAKYIQAQRCLNEARKMYSELPSGYGIDKFSYASILMLSIGNKLNHNLEAGEDEDDMASDDQDEAIDEESEALDVRGRRISTMGLPGGTAGASLETAPLKAQLDASEEGKEKQDTGEAKDDFG